MSVSVYCLSVLELSSVSCEQVVFASIFFSCSFDPNPLQRHTFWTIVIGGTFTWTTIYGVNQSQVQRYISCKSRLHAKL
jgi:hypothetical protein